jgi:hypothetical protein
MKRILVCLVFAGGCLGNLGGGTGGGAGGGGGVGSGGGGSSSGGGSGGNGNNGGGPMGPNCGAQTFPIMLSKAAPNVMLVVDESGSMQDPIAGSTQSKWDALKAAVDALVAKYDGQVDWGLSIFPAVGAADSCAPGIIDVAVGPNTGSQITGKLNPILASSLNGSTPTVETLMAVQAQAGLTDKTRDNYVLLITDGEPTCADAAGVTPVIQALYAQQPSVKTFVVGVGDVNSSNPALLNEWATSGHTDRAGATKYYDATDTMSLQNSFASILGAVASCTYQLQNKPDDPSLVAAYLDGNGIPTDPVNGATYDAASNSITFHGSSCDKIKTGSATKVNVVYGCPSPTIQ